MYSSKIPTIMTVCLFMQSLYTVTGTPAGLSSTETAIVGGVLGPSLAIAVVIIVITVIIVIVKVRLLP